MAIHLPHAPRWLTRIGDWLNEPLWRFRRIDPILVFLGVFCVLYYYWTSGLYMAIVGGAMFGFITMIALWF